MSRILVILQRIYKDIIIDRMKRILGLVFALLILVLPICFTSCGSDETQMTAITLSKSKIDNPPIGYQDTLTAKITPTDAANPNVVWSHTNENVVQITFDGYNAYLKILEHGNDTICCSAAEGNGVRSYCYVTYIEESEVPDTTELDSIE